MHRIVLFLCFVLLFAAAPTAPLAAADPVIEHCRLSSIDEAQISAREAGVLVAIEAHEGVEVKTGEILARIDDSEPAMQKRIKEFDWQTAEEQAKNDVNVRYAKAAADVAQKEYEKAIDANRKVPGAFPEIEVDRLFLTWKKSKLQIEQAALEQRIAGMTALAKKAEVDATQLSIERRLIKSPLDGQVMNIYRHVGEWVAVGDPVLRVVRTDRLRVRGFLNAAAYAPGEVKDRAVSVNIKLGGRELVFKGKVSFVSVDAVPGQEFPVWAEISNRLESGQWVLLPGFDATMTIHMK